MNRNQIFIILILVGLASGSGFYVGHSLMKPSQVLPLAALFFLPMDLVKNRIRFDRLAFWIVVYILLAGLYNLPGLDKDQLIDFGFILSTFLVYIAAFLSAEAISRGDRFPAKVILSLFSVLFVLYLYQVSTETYFLLSSAEEKFYSTTFNNANDMNSFLVAFIPLILFSLQLWKPSGLLTTGLFLVLALWVIVLGSRFCIVAIFVIPFMYLVFSASYIWKLILLSGTGFVGALLAQINWENILKSIADWENPVISRSAARLYLFLYDFEDDKSSSYRLDSYLYAINHAGDAVIGFGTKNYEAFYQAAFGEGTVVSYVPHSYLIENMLAFGWVGLALIVCMLLTCLFAVLSSRTYRFYGMTTFVLFLMVSFVPSTVIRLPILWFPLFFFTHLVRKERSLSTGDDDWLEPSVGKEYGSFYEEAY